MEYLQLLLLAILIVLVLTLIVRASKREDTQALSMMQQQVETLRESVAGKMEHLSGRLGQLDEANRQLLGIGRELADFQQRLLHPKIRGGIGEQLLENLLAQVLPREHFYLQHKFKNGAIVDALIKLTDERSLSIDAKFPLANFLKLAEAPTEREKEAYRKAFFKDVRSHVDAIASRYICPDEGTLDLALMYIPTESIYYEVITQDAEGAPFLEYCQRRSVVPISPNTLYAYLQVISLGLRGLKIEQHAREIVETLSRLKMDFGTLGEALKRTGSHLNNAANTLRQAEKEFTHLEARLDSAETQNGRESSH